MSADCCSAGLYDNAITIVDLAHTSIAAFSYFAISVFPAFRAKYVAMSSSWASVISVLRKKGMIETPLRTKILVEPG